MKSPLVIDSCGSGKEKEISKYHATSPTNDHQPMLVIPIVFGVTGVSSDVFNKRLFITLQMAVILGTNYILQELAKHDLFQALCLLISLYYTQL